MGRRGAAPEPGRLEKDLDILNRRLGGETLEEIAQDLGLTRERIRQRQERALAKLPALRNAPLGRSAINAAVRQRDEAHRLEIISEFRSLRARLHRRPELKELPAHFVYIAERLWGSAKSLAQEAAGGDPEARRSLTQEEADYWFDYALKELGRVPTTTDIRGLCDINGFLRNGQSWSEYVYSRGHWPYRSNDRELMERVLKHNYKNVKERVGHIPSSLELANNGEYTYNTYLIHWGSYINFLKEVGDDEEYRAQRGSVIGHGNKRWTRERLSEAVLTLADKLGRAPTIKEMMDEYHMSCSTIGLYAGSYPVFLSSLGLEPKTRGANA